MKEVVEKKSIVINAKFGALEYDERQRVTFPLGVIGFPDVHDYVLLSMPHLSTQTQFFLLQSRENTQLCFISLPLQEDDDWIHSRDIKKAEEELGIEQGRSRILLIATFERNKQHIKVSINLKAPIIIDLESLQAWQYVFHHAQYPIRHCLMETFSFS